MTIETPLKRFLLFNGQCYYPGGGWDDFIGSFDSLDEAKSVYGGSGGTFDWFQVVDLETGTVVAKN